MHRKNGSRWPAVQARVELGLGFTGKQITLTWRSPAPGLAMWACLTTTAAHDVGYAHGETALVCVGKADFQRILQTHVEFYQAALAHARAPHPRPVRQSKI